MLALNTGRLQDSVYLFFAAAEDSNKIHIGVVPIVDGVNNKRTGGRGRRGSYSSRCQKVQFREFARYLQQWQACRHY